MDIIPRTNQNRVYHPLIFLLLYSLSGENLDLEVEQLEVVTELVIPQSIVAIESPISRNQPPEIYFGPDGKFLPPGLILIEEISQDETPLTPTHFR